MDKMADDNSLQIPIIDISALMSANADRQEVADRIEQACRKWGFFYVIGAPPPAVAAELDRLWLAEWWQNR